MNGETLSVLIVDDHSVVRMGMAALLSAETDLHVVGNAKNGLEAISLARTLQPDVIVMDVEMPRKDGIETTAEIMAEQPDAKILILTSFSTTDRIAKAIKSGALGAIMKNADDSEMVAAIRTVGQGKAYLAKDIKRLFKEDPPVPELSPRQREILDAITRGLTNQDIATQLGISLDMVKKHMTALLQKMNVANRSEAVAIALKKHLLKI
ncbi:MAG: response regulator transcription factor [Kiritimatiellae bacterium]|nr:response regulator transcription factor [Kiritimatiellia bacterium]